MASLADKLQPSTIPKVTYEIRALQAAVCDLTVGDQRYHSHLTKYPRSWASPIDAVTTIGIARPDRSEGSQRRGYNATSQDGLGFLAHFR